MPARLLVFSENGDPTELALPVLVPVARFAAKLPGAVGGDASPSRLSL